MKGGGHALVALMGLAVACGDPATSGLPDGMAADGMTADVRRETSGLDGLNSDGRQAAVHVVLEDDLLVIRHEGRALFTLKAVQQVDFTPEVSMLFGFFRFGRSQEQIRDLAVSVDKKGFTLSEGGVRAGTLTWQPTSGGAIRVTLSFSRGSSAIRLGFHCQQQDGFWGFGEQYNRVDLRGWKVPIWVQEQGVGRAEEPTAPFTGRLTDSYFPIPGFVDPQAGRGFLLEGTAYSEFDLASEVEDTWWVESWGGSEVSFLVFPGPTPLEVISQWTAETGRMSEPPPEWAFSGVWLAAQGGTQAVRNRVAVAREAGVALSAVWVQDWLGYRGFGANHFGVKYHWEHDEDHYPGLEDLIGALAAEDIRFLGYFNPFVVPDYGLFEEAARSGYLIRDPQGRNYVFPIITFEGSLLDVTNPEAVDWFQGYARKAVDMGMAGWMADFGEWLPYDARLSEGQASKVHNLYPLKWHEANLQVLREGRPDGDYLILTRSGYSGSQRVAQVVWAGDQEADWSVEDGLPTVVTAGLTLGLGGIGVFTHDIAGFSGGPSSKELFLRWTELGAFTPVMRTHDGLKKFENHRFDSDAETLQHFVRFSRIHRALGPLWKDLLVDVVERGWPMIRHTAFAFPDWHLGYGAHTQWVLGDVLILAPVTTEGATTATLMVPPGEWEHLLTGEAIAGDGSRVVEAPLGYPAVAVRKGHYPEMVEEIRVLAALAGRAQP
jgi:alpha-glucosidase